MIGTISRELSPLEKRTGSKAAETASSYEDLPLISVTTAADGIRKFPQASDRSAMTSTGSVNIDRQTAGTFFIFEPVFIYPPQQLSIVVPQHIETLLQ